jgi:hypothetical protein
MKRIQSETIWGIFPSFLIVLKQLDCDFCDIFHSIIKQINLEIVRDRWPRTNKSRFFYPLLLFSLNLQTRWHRTTTSLGTGLAYVPLCRLRTREPITRLTQQQPKHFVVTSYSWLYYSINHRTHDPKT